MSGEMTLVQNEDGAFSAYDDTYDIVIHCETEDEQEKEIDWTDIIAWMPLPKPYKED